MKRTWISLSQDLRNDISRFASLRIGYFLVLIASFLWYVSKASKGFIPFIDSLFSLTNLVILSIIFFLPLYLFRRSSDLAVMAIDEYKQLLPSHCDKIDEVYGERGGADVIAPWIMSKESYLFKVAKRLGDKIFRI